MKKLEPSQKSFIKACVWAILMGCCLRNVIDSIEERGYELHKEGKVLLK